MRASARLKAVSDMFTRGGVEIKQSNDIRRDVWQKLTLNASGNTLAALTRIDLGGLGVDPGLCELAMNVMREAIAVAAKQGWDLTAEMDVEKLAKRGKPGQRPSMLQDVLAGRPTEIESINGAVVVAAQRHGVRVPHTETLMQLVRLVQAQSAHPQTP